jgi:hypothetical protein
MGPNPAIPTPIGSAPVQPAVDAELRSRLGALCSEGWAIWERFAADVGDRYFHPFVAAEYELVCEALLVHRGPSLRFLEWGSATGVITVMADLLGFEAHGIELDGSLVTVARALAGRFDSRARFAAGSFLPAGYRWRPSDGDGRIGTLGTGPSGYLQLGRSLDEFDLVFGYPWDGEEPMMLDLMNSFGRPGSVLLLNSVTAGIVAYQGGRRIGPAVTRAGVVPAGTSGAG